MIDVVAADLPALLAQIDGSVTVRKHLTLAVAGATVERHELPFQLRLLDVLLDPNLITLLFLGGILGIAFELTHPGIVLPGLLGTVALLLALLGLSIVPFSWAGVALLVFGIALLGARGAQPGPRSVRGGGDARGAARRRAAVPRRQLALRDDQLLAGARDRGLARVDQRCSWSAASGRRGACRRAAPACRWSASTRWSSRGCDPHGQVLVHGERWQAAAGRAAVPSRASSCASPAQHRLTLEVERAPAARRPRSPCDP